MPLDLDKQDRKFMLLLYPDNKEHNMAIGLLDKFYSGAYAYILHDQDIDEVGEIKKAHWHVVLKLNNPVRRQNIANKLGIDKRFVTPVYRYEQALRYLLHVDDKDKFQYEITSVQGSLVRDLEKVIAKDSFTDLEILDRIVDFINLSDHTGTWSAVYHFVSKNGYLSVYRRYYSIIKDLFIDKNRSRFIDL